MQADKPKGTENLKATENNFISKKNPNKRSYKKHIVSSNIETCDLDLPCYKIVDGIKIYDGTTLRSRELYERKNKILRALLPPGQKIFTDPVPSTLTAKGKMTNLNFKEAELIKLLKPPKLPIYKIGCNFGELYDGMHVEPVWINTSGRGRRPMPRLPPKRKIPGTGKYFSSQITFFIKIRKQNAPDAQTENADNEADHKIKKNNKKRDKKENFMYFPIKLFRNGVFQVPGVSSPTMDDLVRPVIILRDYLRECIDPNINIVDFKAVMRNYKCELINKNLVVNPEEIKTEILNKKNNDGVKKRAADLIMKSGGDQNMVNRVIRYIGNLNMMNIAEICYNTDKCFSLIIKFYRPIPTDLEKKTTVKILKSGKINFDGGNNEQEMLELYHWLEYMYWKNRDRFIFDVSQIKNVEDNDLPPEYYKHNAGENDLFNHCREENNAIDIRDISGVPGTLDNVIPEPIYDDEVELCTDEEDFRIVSKLQTRRKLPSSDMHEKLNALNNYIREKK